MNKKNEKSSRKKGQLSIVGMLWVVLGIMVLALLFPIILAFTGIGYNASTTSQDQTLWQTLPTFVIVLMMIGAAMYFNPQRPQQY